MTITSSSGSKVKPLPPLSVQFLGTSSGGGPILSRNCSSLGVDFGNEIWLFDAADATLFRLHQSSLRIANITRIFITHMHADHVLGLVPVLTTVMSGIGVKPGETERLKELGTKKKATFNIYGPAGLRKLVRTCLSLTSANLAGVFAVHELFQDGEGPSVGCEEEDLHPNEAVGMDLRADNEGVWKEILAEGNGKSGRGWSVSAGPIEHRVPSLGYILQEPLPRLPLDTANLVPLLQANAEALAVLDPPVKHPLSLLSHLTSLPSPPPYTLPSGDILTAPQPSGITPRKLVIFGDCAGGTRNDAFRTMCEDASLLIHECTNASIPENIQKGDKGNKVRSKDLAPSLVAKRDEEQAAESKSHGERSKRPHAVEEGVSPDDAKKAEVRKKAQSRGHSTPDEVGEFARAIRARRLVVNHFSAMFPSPRYPSSDPFSSILSPISPFPYPTPYPIAHSSDPPFPPHPLTHSELHTRLIMHSIADQITNIWVERGDQHLAVPARDFMVYRITGHESSESEADEVREHKSQASEVMNSWQRVGGVWLEAEKEGRRWIGVGSPDESAFVYKQ
ncbi:hypothetical protein CI109_103556 [Kwoniella shandongensis]|uniref:Uncharacterized protein n=1 Tax=Kwoniella shandongensis TaxID=1734106 RepID=A0A5M6BVY2_9TREE|nr:uncharacterized protein CI109_004542 [Kwoniella shandongensis]KAA5527007.1 hypothetical protein CI109_004542 [Kwoniella shandongensis]